MEVVFGLEHPVGPERVTLSLPPQVELNAAELSTFIAELVKVRDGMLPAILREDRAPLARCEHSAVMERVSPIPTMLPTRSRMRRPKCASCATRARGRRAS
jgi:hypothetical protein